MGVEIERKFLVAGDGWRREVGDGKRLRQAYLSDNQRASVRVRISDNVDARLTVKAAKSGLSRAEFEYEIPVADATEMMSMRKGAIIEKTRYKVQKGDVTWEIDEFDGENTGLILAEIELVDEAQSFDPPAWLGREVTADRRYYNSDLARTPFAQWD